METCERCGAVLDPADSHCTTCGAEFETEIETELETAQYCVACGVEIDSELDWGEEGLCRSCAEQYAGLP